MKHEGESGARVQGLLVSGGGTSGSWVTLWIWCIPLGHHSSADLRCHPGALVNTAYYGACSLIEEFMTAATELFSEKCLLQFEDNENNRCVGNMGRPGCLKQQGCLLQGHSILGLGPVGPKRDASRTSTPTMPSLYWRLGDATPGDSPLITINRHISHH